MPTRGLLGLRNAILTASRGTAILNTIFDSYGPWAGGITTRDQGSLVISHIAFIHLKGSDIEMSAVSWHKLCRCSDNTVLIIL